MAGMAGGAAARAALAQALREVAGRAYPEVARAVAAAAARQGAAGAAAAGAGPAGRYDRAIDMVNRLPRPALMAGTVALFAYSVAAPEAFARRMAALADVPEPLWWLIGSVVALHFGAREAHHFRDRPPAAPPPPTAAAPPPLPRAGEAGAGPVPPAANLP